MKFNNFLKIYYFINLIILIFCYFEVFSKFKLLLNLNIKIIMFLIKHKNYARNRKFNK